MYIISVYSENQVGLLSSISNIFTRRGINIESLTVFPSEFPGIHHFTFRAITTERAAQQVVGFIEKKVEVVRAFCSAPMSSVRSVITSPLTAMVAAVQGVPEANCG